MKPVTRAVSAILNSILLLNFTACATPHTTAPANGIGSSRLSVVKIYVSVQGEDYQMPWQSGRPGSASGTGFLISGKRILTNAHVVSNVRFLQVQKDGDPKKYLARVKYIGHDCDLAMLEVEDEEFFQNMLPVSFATAMPNLNDEVYVIGYPMGGERVSITRGVVSRIDFGIYAHSGVDQHLTMQVDAAINPGNSGGPIFFDGKVVAVAFQGLSSGDNIGYGIPLPVIEHFLKDTEDGKYNGYPELGIGYLEGHNTGLRKTYSIPESSSGVIVSYIDPFGAADKLLQPGDFLEKIDSFDIQNDGSVELEGNAVNFTELMERKQWGESVVFDLFRNGSLTNLIISLTNPPDPFSYRHVYDEKPEYYIMAGLVFAPVNRALLNTIRHSGAQNRSQIYYFSEYAKVDNLFKDREQFIVMMRRLPHTANTYSEPFINGIVSEINGIKIASLKDVKRAFGSAQDGFHTVSFEGIEDRLVLEEQKAIEADSEILTSYGIMEKEYFKE